MKIKYILKIILLVFAVSVAFSQNAKKLQYKTLRYGNPVSINNSQIIIITDQPSGRFSIVTTEHQNLLFYDYARPELFTGHINLKIDDSLYSNEPQISQIVSSEMLSGQISKSPTNINTLFEIPSKKISINQKTTLVRYGNFYGVLIEYLIKNNDTVSHQAGLLNEFDTQINTNDASFFLSEFGPAAKETLFTANKMPLYWQAAEKKNLDSGLTGQGNLKGIFSFKNDSGIVLKTLLTPPDYLYVAEWEKCSSILWDILPKIGDIIYDSGLLLKWNQKTLKPDSTIYIASYIGIGKRINNNFLSTSINIPKIKLINKNYQPNPFEFQVAVQNTTDKTINSIFGRINLPQFLALAEIDNLQILTPANLEPFETGIFSYRIRAPFTLQALTLPVEMEIFSVQNPSFKITDYVVIPPAPGIDFFKPVIETEEIKCSIKGKVYDNKLYDKGLDTIIIDTSKNLRITIEPYKKGAAEAAFTADYDNPKEESYIKIRAIDIAGNTLEKEIRFYPKYAGFDTVLRFIPGREISIPLWLKDIPQPFLDTAFKVKIKYDKAFLTPLEIPFSMENSQSGKMKVSSFEITDSTISINVSGRNTFSNGSLLDFLFIVKNKPPDSASLEVVDLKFPDSKYCPGFSNARINRFYTDSSAPLITLRQKGTKLYATITDNGPGETGIYSVSLMYSENALLNTNVFVPGIKTLEVDLKSIDSTIAMNGILKVIDGAGNIIRKYFELSPVYVTLDTLRLMNNDIAYVNPKINSRTQDTTFSEYEFSLKYDSTVLRLIPPYYETGNTISNSLQIKIDTSVKGIIKVIGTGNGALRISDLIRLKFQVIPGDDKTAHLILDNFIIDKGDRFVLIRNSEVIRINMDKVPPLIKCEQRRNRLDIFVSEKREYDIGLKIVEFSNPINFPLVIIPTNSYESLFKYYELQMLDSTKYASIKISAIDFLGNRSDTTLEIYPVRLELPVNLRGQEYDTLKIPLRISGNKSLRINRMKFNLDFDDNMLSPLNPPYSAAGSLSEKSSFIIKAKNSSISFDISFPSGLDTTNDLLLRAYLKMQTGLPALSTIRISSISLNNDSLFMYSTESTVKRYFFDTLPPVVSLIQKGCSIKAFLSDSRKNDSKLVEIRLDSNINFNDTLNFIFPFYRLDSTATFEIFPKDPKLASSAILHVGDYENNFSRIKIEINPLNLQLPERITLFPDSNASFPVYINGYTTQKINNISLKIKYDNTSIKVDSLSTIGCLISDCSYSFENVDILKINIKPKSTPTNNKLFNFYIKAIKGPRKLTPIIFEYYSINNDTLCVNKNDGLFERRGVDSILVSINNAITGKYASDISIPVNLKADNVITRLNGYSMKISYNGTMLNPYSINTSGTASEKCNIRVLSKDNNGNLHFEALGAINISNKNLCVLTTKVLVGNDNSTPLRIEGINFYYDSAATTDKLFLSSSDGSFTLDSLSEWQKGLRYKGNVLLQNSPNPYNSTTKIIFNLKDRSFVKLKIYDILGRIVSTPINESMEEGMHQFMFNAAGLTSGVYFYKIETECFSQIKKMILLK